MIQGILLAAGHSTRFGANKLLHPLADQTPVIIKSATTFINVITDYLIIVQSHQHDLINLLKFHGLHYFISENADKGMGHTIADAISYTSHAEGWIIALADMPYIQPSTIEQVKKSLLDGSLICAPFFKNRRGHPVGYTSNFYSQLCALSGDQGAKQIIKDNPDLVTKIETNDPGILTDIDSPSDLLSN